MNTGYIKIPVNAVRTIRNYSNATEDSAEGLRLLTAYLKLRWHEYDGPAGLVERGQPGGHTAAGARAISKATKVSSERAKKVLRNLLTPPESLSAQPFIVATEAKQALAPVYKFTPWEGPIAYLPAALWDGEGGGALTKVLDAPAPTSVRLTAMCLLVELYARMDYDWLAVPPDRFMHQRLRVRACAPAFRKGYTFWLAEASNTWEIAPGICKELTGYEAPSPLLLAAFGLLLNLGLICRVMVVDTKEFRYPLYVHYRAAAASLNERGILTDLTRRFLRAAVRDGDITAREVNAAAGKKPGTGLYHCLSQSTPTVYVLLAPCLHAPTPMNLSGMEEVAERTSRMNDLLLLPPVIEEEPPVLERPFEDDPEEKDPFEGIF